MTRMMRNSAFYKRASKQTLLDTVNEVVDREVQKSSVFDISKEECIPRFHPDEIVFGMVLGRGSFCVVRELNELRLQKQIGLKEDPKTENENESTTTTSSHNRSSESSREDLARRVVFGSKCGSNNRFVVKQVDANLSQTDRLVLLKGTIDLALEMKYLASLEHRNILSIRGICSTSPCNEIGYFVILDSLPEILTHRLASWAKTDRNTKGLAGLVSRGKKRSAGLLCERLTVAFDIAQAMKYIHSRQIVFRDLKPENIGFNADRVLKLFDFGLAKELRMEDEEEDGLYNLTGLTGAIRYMAPEVGLHQPYNLKADVYSWTMVLWYIMALEPPMGLYTPSMIVERVFNDKCRPTLNSKWPNDIISLMTKSWHANLHRRPTFQDILNVLGKVIKELKGSR